MPPVTAHAVRAFYLRLSGHASALPPGLQAWVVDPAVSSSGQRAAAFTLPADHSVPHVVAARVHAWLPPLAGRR